MIALASEARSFTRQSLDRRRTYRCDWLLSGRAAGFDDAYSVISGVFRRPKVDAITRWRSRKRWQTWIGAGTPVRVRGHAFWRRFSTVRATQFLEKQFGADAAADERARQRMAYESIAKRDSPLSRTTPLEPTYVNSISNKGSMVWRLTAGLLGRDTFIATVRQLLASGKTDVEGFSLARLRTTLAERGGETVKKS